jgi:hypothetical protein
MLRVELGGNTAGLLKRADGRIPKRRVLRVVHVRRVDQLACVRAWPDRKPILTAEWAMLVEPARCQRDVAS